MLIYHGGRRLQNVLRDRTYTRFTGRVQPSPFSLFIIASCAFSTNRTIILFCLNQAIIPRMLTLSAIVLISLKDNLFDFIISTTCKCTYSLFCSHFRLLFTCPNIFICRDYKTNVLPNGYGSCMIEQQTQIHTYIRTHNSISLG